jgi:hypothetical protein
MPDAPELELRRDTGAADVVRASDADAGAEAPEAGALEERWWERPLMVGLVVSMFLHVVLAFGLAVTLIRGPSNPGGDVGGGETISFGDDSSYELVSLPGAPMGGGGLGGVESSVQAESFSISDVTSPFSQADALGGDAGGMPGLTGAGSGAGGTGDGMGLTGAGGGEARFFGVEARGSRFAYVVDISGSMMDTAKLGALQAALTESIEGMLQQAHFCVALFSSGAFPLVSEQWTRATDDKKQLARRNIRGISASGGTNPLPGFEMVFALKPRPDAIYFMTDGVFTPDIEAKLPGMIEKFQRQGDDARVPIHCITFVDRGAEKLMRRIARQTGGTYTHVAGPKP